MRQLLHEQRRLWSQVGAEPRVPRATCAPSVERRGPRGSSGGGTLGLEDQAGTRPVRSLPLPTATVPRTPAPWQGDRAARCYESLGLRQTFEQ